MSKSVYEILLQIEGDQKLTQSLNEVGTQLGLTGAALTAFGVGAAKLNADFETSLANIATVSTEATGSTEEFSTALFDLQRNMEGAINIQEAANSSYEMLSAGISDQGAIMKALELSQKAAIGGQSSLNSVVTAAIAGVNSYGDALGVGSDQTAQFEKVINLMMQTQLDGVITADQYAASFGQIASLAASSGTSLEGLNAIIAATTAKGIPASIAMTNVKAAISNIQVPSKSATEEAARLGIQFDAVALQAKGLDGVLIDIANSGKANAETISKLFGSTEAQSSVAALLGDMDLLNTMIERQVNGMGALDVVYSKVGDTANQKVVKSLNLIKGALIEIGQGAIVVMAPILDLFGKLAAALSAMPGWAKAVVGGFSVLAGVTLTLVGAGALLVTSLASVVTSYGTLTTSIGLTIAAMKANAAATIMMSGPITNFQLAQITAAKATGVLGTALSALTAKLVTLLPMVAKLGLVGMAAGSLYLIKDTLDAVGAGSNETRQSLEDLDGTLRKINETAESSTINELVPDEATANLDALNDKLGFFQRRLDDIREGIGIMTALELAVKNQSKAFQELLIRVNDVKVEASTVANELEAGFDVDPERVKAALDSIAATIEALRSQQLTRPEEIAARDQQIEQLEKTKARITDLSQSTEVATEATGQNTEEVEDAGKAYEDYAAKIKGAIAAIDAQKDVDIGNLTGSDADKVTETLAIEEAATAEKIAMLQDLAAQSQTTAEERRDIEIQIQREMMELNKARIDAAKKLEEEFNEYHRSRLSQRKAELEASALESGASIADTYEARRQLIQDEFQLETDILNRQIAQTVEGSAERAKAESELANLRVEKLEEEKRLGDELKAHQEAREQEAAQKAKDRLDQRLADLSNYYGQAIEQATYAQQWLEGSGQLLDVFAEHAEGMIGILGQVNSLLESDNTTLAQRAELIGLAEELTGQTFRTNENMSAMEQASLALQAQLAQFELEKLNLKIEQLQIDKESLEVAREIKNLEIENRRANIQAELEGNPDLTGAQRTAKTRELQSLDREQQFNNEKTDFGLRSLDNQIQIADLEKRLADIMSRNIGTGTSSDLSKRASDAIAGGDREAEKEAISEARGAYRDGTITREDLDEILENSREAQKQREEEARKAQEERQRDRENGNRVTTQSNNSLASVASSSRETADRVGAVADTSKGISDLARINDQMLKVQQGISIKLDRISQQVGALPGSIASAIPRPAAIPSRR